MSHQTDAQPCALEVSLHYVSLISDVQTAIVELSVAVRSHLAEMQRVAPGQPYHQEAHREAVALTALRLAETTDALNEAFAPLRHDTRRLGRLIREAAISPGTNNT